MVEPTLRRAILDKIDELRTLATALPSDAPPLPPPPDPSPPDPDPEPDPHPDHPGDLEPATPVAPTGILWSDPATWPDGIPTAETDVVIHGEMTIDGTAHCRTLTIQHHSLVTLAGHLHAHGSVIVEGGATLQGTAGTISFFVEDDRVFVGAHGHLPTPEDTGLWAMPGSKIDFRGRAVTPWRSTIPSVAGEQQLKYGATSRRTMVPGQWGDPDPSVATPGMVSLADGSPVGWRDGDPILLTNEKGQARLVRQVHRHAYHLNHDGGDFAGGDIRYGGSVRGSAKIANLSRSILIESALCKPGDTNHRAHTIALRGANVRYENVAFRNLGPRGKLGLYPVHVHHGLDSTPAVIEGCAVYQDCGQAGNRCIVIHDSENVVCRNNVCYSSFGHALMMESGTERGCTVTGNLVVGATGKEELPVFSPSSTSRVALAHAFWLWAGNTISGNVSVSSTGIGIVVFGQDVPGAPPAPQAVIDGHEHYGGHSGAWVSRGGRINNLRSFNASMGTHPGSPAGFQDIDSSFIYGPIGLSGYNYVGHRVTNSTILADIIASTHGMTLISVDGSRLVGEWLVAHDIRKAAMHVRGSHVRLSEGVLKSIEFDPLQHNTIYRLTDCDAVIAGETIVTADFTDRRDMHHVYGFEGRPIGKGRGWILDGKAPVPGFLKLHPDHTGRHRMTPVGREPLHASTMHISRGRSGPESHEMGLDGYWGGFAPGRWRLEAWPSRTADVPPALDTEIEIVAGETLLIDAGF